VRDEGERKERGGGPAEEEGDRVGEQGSGPAEIPLYVAVAIELCVGLGGECTGEEDSEEQEDDAANLAGERRLRGPIVPVPARAS
jgi:hypothetical protein